MVHWPIGAARRAGSVWVLLALAGLGGCSTRADSARVLGLTQVRPKNPTGVYLNEALVFHFDAELDPASVHRRSVRIAAVDGRSPRGELFVDGDEIRFEPAPVLARTLDDGGYLPDTEYTVRLAGFPFPDGLRSKDGAPLARSVEWRFRTVSISSPRAGPVFEDQSPEVGRPIQINGAEPKLVSPTGPIELEGGEPIDPSSLRAEDFVLRPIRRLAGVVKRGDRVPLRAVLVDNRDPLDHVSRGRTIVHLVPVVTLAAGEYELWIEPTVALLDFGGHPVWPFSTRRLHLRVEAGAAEASVGSHVESFVDTALRSPAEVPQADGTALWSGVSGKVEVRYPAAAGDGSVGNVSLSGEETRRDLSARQIEVARGETVSLGSAPGLVVLRSQRRFTIAGTLVRDAGGALGPLGEPTTLSSWLASERERDLAAVRDPSLPRSSWTVLVAGGDLTISGRVRVAGPLLLVAGGRIRISGELEVVDADGRARTIGPGFYLEKLGGGIVLMHWGVAAGEDAPKGGRNELIVRGAPELPWVLDPPIRNPLQPGEKLVFQVLSAAIPPEGGVQRWHSGAIVNGFAGNRRAVVPDGEASIRVRFIGESAAAGSGEVCVDDPALFAEAKSLRLLLELNVFADAIGPSTPATADRPSWDPPWIDDVTLSWDRVEGAER